MNAALCLMICREPYPKVLDDVNLPQRALHPEPTVSECFVILTSGSTRARRLPASVRSAYSCSLSVDVQVLQSL